LEGITTFKFSDGSSPEDVPVNELNTIDLHHGTDSANPPYTVLDVIGTAITPRIKTALAQLGFDEFQEIPQGSVRYGLFPLRLRLRRLAIHLHIAH
jgi:hypothetical protein